MATGCPKCGWQTVEGPQCPRCGVNVAEYRAQLAVASAVARPPGQPVAQPTPPPRPETGSTAASPFPMINPAGFWIRFVARMIDGVLLLMVVAVLPLLGALVSVAYEIFFHWRWGQTLGKMAMRVRVVTMAGGPLSVGESVLRWFGTLVSTFLLCIGYLMAAFRADKRALHDLIAGTRVEYVP
ncbi:MAG TPA: RDD family protein [Methylomirabilota bacterium]|nr:RDD family protein [Methylomirabilota bacterium]